VGAASADFQLRTGRMPAGWPTAQPPQKEPAFTDDQIVDLVAYVASLGDGPPIPDIDPSLGDLAEGSELFLANCAACHNSAGIGGALSYGRHAPPLLDVEPTQIGEAIRVGPGTMPVFGPDTLSDQQVNSIVRYVQYLQEPEHPGGLMIGRAGPVPEGFVAWLVGLGALVLVIRWITREPPRA
jgi:ubiquinol-cytochrome c reductase cytochrome c subunit